MPAIAAKDQFEFVDDLRIRHNPTGWEFSSYRYDDPADVRISFERISDEGDFEIGQIRSIALSMLRARAGSRK